MKKNNQQLPLNGIRVLDCSRLIPGPFCSLILSDLGASVNKINDPTKKDYLKSIPPLLNNKIGALYSAFNRGKKELTLSLTEKKDQSKIEALIKKTDVLIESFRPGILASMGWPLKKLQRLNKKLIVASITGFGQSGPNKTKAGHDLNYMAMSGLLGRGVPHKEGPVGSRAALTIPEVQWADLVGGGVMGALMIVAALANKNRRFCHLDISMTDNMAFLGLGKILMSQVGADSGILNGVLARYRLYRTKDGGFVSLGALEDKFFNRFCDLVGKPNLKQSGYGDMSETIHKELEELFLSKTRQEWEMLGDVHDICLTPVFSSSEIIHTKQFTNRKFFVKKKVGSKAVLFPRLPC